MEEYERDFNHLSCFASRLVVTEEQKVECWACGLIFKAETLEDLEYPTEDTQTHLDVTVDQKRKRE